MKIILSQGQGRIQLGQAGALLKESGIKVKYLTGWLPKKINPIIVNFLGKIVGRADLYKRLMVRQPVGLDDDDIISCSKSEFYLWFLIILVRLKLLKEDNALTWGWKLFR
ncbi:hypothetical protein QF042_000666 [Pedobacter sp. W3I1]|uniref:hypothetical protein n=1 Tax=Pedobacter sp. W3I1 TaxID=3042291 RepID=UPI0027852B22|nr:hypothetical protein [Pedobacter sp. W3I1]MDQ0637101.1 hypothetical protein [Pedobacter sp. W3I1]